MSKTTITLPNLAPPVGPFPKPLTQAFHQCQRQVGQDPTTGKLVAGGIAAETDRVVKNLAAVLNAAGKGFDNVARAGVYLTNMSDYLSLNATSATVSTKFSDPRYPDPVFGAGVRSVGRSLRSDSAARRRASLLRR